MELIQIALRVLRAARSPQVDLERSQVETNPVLGYSWGNGRITGITMTPQQDRALRRLIRDYREAGIDRVRISRGAHDLSRKRWFNPPPVTTDEVNDVLEEEGCYRLEDSDL